jgi:hypothetical protein
MANAPGRGRGAACYIDFTMFAFTALLLLLGVPRAR